MTDWPVKTLGEVAKVGAGNSAPQDKALFKNGVHRFVRTSDVGQVRIGRLGQSADLLNDEGTKGLHKFRAGVTLMPKSGASTFLNHRVQLTKPCFVSSHLAVVDPNPNLVDDTFMFYFLQTVRSQDLIQDQSYPSLNLPAISGINVLVPPLEEQKRIVELLDAATARVTELTACYEQARTHANDLFTSTLRAELESNSDWPVKTLGEICELISRGRPPSYCEVEGVVVLNQKCVRNGKIDFGQSRRTDNNVKVIPEWSYLREGDTLINSTGAGTLGRASFVAQLDEPTTFDTHLTVVRPRREICWPAFIGLVLNGREKDIVDLAEGATGQTELPREAVRSFEIPVPPLEEQKQIVARLDSMRAKTSEMVAGYDAKLTAAKNLRQSILEAAFAGDL